MQEQNVDNQEPKVTDESSNLDRLTMLKKRADELGITYSNNIGADSLSKRINDKLDGKEVSSDPEKNEEVQVARRKTKEELDQEIREEQRLEHMRLLRCRIYNLNPSKNDLQGEIITIANRYLGTVRKFIPFGEATDNGYHVPKILVEDLKRRKYQSVKTSRDAKGQIQVKTRMVPEYQIEVLPPLTREELNELALSQQAAERVGVN